MPLTEVPPSSSGGAAASVNNVGKQQQLSPAPSTASTAVSRPSYPSSRRDSNILGNRASLTKNRSLTETQTSSTSSSPVFNSNGGTDHEDDDQDENDQRNSNQIKKDAARPHYKEGIRLAEMGKWGTLVVRLQKEPQLARHKDHHGMLPLHWACTEDDVPSSVIQALLKASPEAVLTKNNAQYLPLHIAVRARVGQETLRLLCQARPSSLLEGTPSGKTALMLAKEVNLPAESMEVLRKAEQDYLDLTVDRESTNNDYEDTKREIAVQSQRLRESMMMPPPQQPGPIQRTFSGRRNTTTVSTSSSGTTFITIANSNDVAPGFGMIGNNSNQNNNNQNNSNQNAAGNIRASGTQNGNFRASASNNSDYYGEQLQSFDQFQHNTAPSRLTGNMDDLDAEFRRLSRVQPQSQQQQQRHHHEEPHHHEQPLTPSMYESEGNSAVCGVCYKKFSMFRKKYQCKGCAVYLCKKHVAGKVMFPTYPKKRSACGDCYRIYRSDPIPVGGTIGTAPAAAGRTPSFTSSTTTGTTITQRNPSDPRDRNSSLRNTTGSVSSNGQPNRSSRATSTQSLVGRPSTVPGPQANLRYSMNAAASRPRLGNASMFNSRTSSSVDRYNSETTVSMIESDPTSSAEITALQSRITGLEDQNKTLLTRLADQEKQYNEAMLLLTETMTRVAELEIKLPSMGLKHTFGTSTTSENRESNILGDYDFDFPTPFNEKFD